MPTLSVDISESMALLVNVSVELRQFELCKYMTVSIIQHLFPKFKHPSLAWMMQSLKQKQRSFVV
jgi:hypothetical protein